MVKESNGQCKRGVRMRSFGPSIEFWCYLGDNGRYPAMVSRDDGEEERGFVGFPVCMSE